MTAPLGTITVEIAEDRSITIRSEGSITPESIALACFFLTRTANQILDAAAFQQAQRDDPQGLAIVRSMPDPDFLPQNGKRGS